MQALTATEVAEQLRHAIRGEAPVTLQPHWPTWDDVYAGNVEFVIGDWSITIFNDCDELDYVDSATAPDGRTAECNEWWAAEQDPLRGFTKEEREELTKLLKAAR